MRAYKATYNFKCLEQLYRVGKTYTSDKLEMCKHGFHYCENMEHTMNFYSANDKFVLLEIEILGNVIHGDLNKSVTDKIKVIRAVPFEEYTHNMKANFPTFEWDEKGNLISQTWYDDKKHIYEYDERNNRISHTYPWGDKTFWEYDERNNRISERYSNGRDPVFWEYDERNNRISETHAFGNHIWEYDERNNMISETYPSGDKYTFEYDENNKRVSLTHPRGKKFMFDNTNVTEE
jgi:YD repeat-containing protein